jgi:hypothetical protein
VKELYTWDEKARQILKVYDFVEGAEGKPPNFGFLGDISG